MTDSVVDQISPAATAAADDIMFRTYQDALDRTHELIDPAHIRSATLDDVHRNAEHRLDRQRTYLAASGNPHRAVPIVHVAGTSGKGSTATAIASVLTEAGFRTGLHTSPYLQSATEKLQVDRSLISADKFASLVESTLARWDYLFPLEDERVTYGELWTSMAFHWFEQEAVDIGVLETGAGGRFDLTNAVHPVISVITPIGLDHIDTLGGTIDQIAWHKAGIIKAGVPVVTFASTPNALDVIELEARQQNSTLVLVDDKVIRDTVAELALSPAIPAFQLGNIAMATQTVRHLEKAGFPVSTPELRQGIDKARIPGRVETAQTSPTVILDGAHNAQKMSALFASLPSMLADPVDGKLIAVVGALESKDLETLLAPSLSCVSEYICTQSSTPGKHAAPPKDILSALRAAGFEGPIHIAATPGSSVRTALNQANDPQRDSVVITGSMYVVGQSRALWYSTPDIVVGQTPWPETNI